MHQKAKTYKAI